MVPNYERVHHRHGHLAHSNGGSFPTLSRSHSGSGDPPKGSRRSIIQGVLQAVVLLCVLLPLWMLLSRSGGGSSAQGEVHGGMGNAAGRRMMSQEVAIYRPASHLRKLVLVAGHAVFVGLNYAESNQENVWFLEEYQKVPGEAQSFVDHIQLGVQEAAKDPQALLLFSGGQTRKEAGPRSEGMSYWVVAEAANWFNTTGVRNRTFTEEHARDSFENLLFSLCRFYELAGHYPDDVTVVSYTLKKSRFLTLHREALRFPYEHFHFIGTPVPPAAKGAEAGEAGTVAAFRENPYGCKGMLQQKRDGRDPFAVGPIHPSRCPDMRGLLTHCSEHLYEGSLPWDLQG